MGGILDWYKKRYRRLLVPYAVIAGVWYFIEYFLLEFNPVGLLYEFSTLSFWLEHKGAWYVVFCIIWYLLYPLIFKWIIQNRFTAEIRMITLIAVILFTGFIVYWISAKEYDDLSKIFNCFIVGVLGTYIAYVLANDRKLKVFKWGMIIVCCYFILMQIINPLKSVAPISSLKSLMFSVVIYLMSAVTIGRLRNSNFDKVLSRYGEVSLEMYLCNIFLIQAYGVLKKVQVNIR
ncbi:MAG: acyltransferase [Lachnospiraceae bacterium]|nr:acyltransferase [Lachnospiraceae bacterium]